MRIYATERYYDELKNLCEDNNEIKGIDGEKEVFHYLKPLSSNKYKGFIIPNFKFKYGDENVECDFVVVTKNSIIILEVKKWRNPVEINKIGEIKTSDNQTRGNIQAQVNRQCTFLEETIRSDLGFEITINSCILFENPHEHNIDSANNIIDYSSVVPKINEFMSSNNQIELNLKKLHDYFWNKNINLRINKEYYFKNSAKADDESFLSLTHIDDEPDKNNRDEYIRPNLYNHIKYTFRTSSDKRESGYNVFIPKNIQGNISQIDDRPFAIIYNLVIRGNGFLIPKSLLDSIENKKIKLEVHFFLITTLLMIKKGNCTLNNGMIDIPLCCENNEICDYSKQVLEHWLNLFSSISNITNYRIAYTKSKYSVIYNLTSINNIYNDELVYVRPIHQFSSDRNEIQYDDDIWSSSEVKYSLNRDPDALMELVETLFGFYSFREGQFECIQNVFSSNDNQIIMLPTGQGKSLVFYLLLLLQPKMGIIVYPTSLLITDQIAKLNSFGIYNINNFNISKSFNNQLIQMMKPEDILEKSVLEKFINMNQKISISYLILDEVHCLSKFSHDFRPEYFLMHDKINYYLNNTVVKGFTATATWEVLEDLRSQFKMSLKDIFSPNLLRRHIKYIIKKTNYNEPVEMLKQDIEYIRGKYNGEKILVFSNNEVDVKYLENNLNLSNVVYAVDQKDFNDQIDLFRYSDDVLVSLNDVGIGIDIPEINTVIHYNQPYSIADFAQHTGRGGRADYSCTSIVYYSDNDFYSYIDHRDMEKVIITIYDILMSRFNEGYNWAEVQVDSNNIADLKFAFFSFFQLGIISEWWRENDDCFGIGINHEFNMDFQQIRRHVFRDMNGDQSLLQKIKNAKDIVELVSGYYSWFIEWNNIFKSNSYLTMKKLLEKITNEKLDNNDIQKIVKLETHYSNVEIVEIDKIRSMNFNEIIGFVKDNYNSINVYKKFQNSTEPKIVLLSILMDFIGNESTNRIIPKINMLISSLSINEQVDLVKSILKVDYILQYDLLIDAIYTDIFKSMNYDIKKDLFDCVENSSLKESYKFLFFLSLINENLREVANE